MGARRRRFTDHREFRRRRTVSSGAGLVIVRQQRSSANVRRRVGVDAQRLSPLPWLPRRPRRARRIQREVHVQPDGFARRILRHFTQPRSADLPQFLSARKALAIHRPPARARPVMSGVPGRVTVLDLEPVKADFLAEVVAGLSSSPRTLPCKFFYDERGADLFQRICELPEYYITRTETELLRRSAPEISESIGANAALIGFGTGAGTKTRMLLEQLENPIAYIPVDISKQRRIEMHLVSEGEQTVRVGGREFRFGDGERVITEFSYKHTLDGFARLAASAGFREASRVWTDPAKMFSIFHFAVAE